MRDGVHLRAAMACAAPYTDLESPAGQETTRPLEPELQNSRRARGLVAWAALSQLGKEGVAGLVDGLCDRADSLASRLEDAGVEVLHHAFNQVLVTFGASTARVAAAVQEDGRCWAAAASFHGRPVLRLSVCSWATTEDDIDLAVRAILECARAVSADAASGVS